MNIIDLNANVRVKLTDLGKAKLKKKNRKIEILELNQGYWEAPLWEVLTELGEYFYQGWLSDGTVMMSIQ